MWHLFEIMFLGLLTPLVLSLESGVSDNTVCDTATFLNRVAYLRESCHKISDFVGVEFDF
jgi:hypothetical protein